MGKKLVLGLVVFAALAPLSEAQAAGMDGEDLEAIVADLESVFGRLEGVDFDALEFRDLGNGLSSVGIPLSEAARERFLAASASDALAADFKVMATGLQLTEPTSTSVLITAADALDNTLYNFWFVVGNLRSTTQIRRTIFQMKGPGRGFKFVQHIDYRPFFLEVFVTDTPRTSGDIGFHTIQAKVAGGGKVKTIYFAQPPE